MVGGVEVGFLAGTFDEDFDSLAYEALIVLLGDFVLHFEQLGIATAFDIVRNVIEQTPGAGGAGSRRVFEYKAVFVAHPLHKGSGGGEILIGFVRETHDKIAGNGDFGHDASGAVDEIKVFLGGVATVHGFEDAVGTGLGGDMQIRADMGQIGNGAENAIVEVEGVAGDEAQTRQAGQIVQLFEHIGEAQRKALIDVSVGVDRLAQ